MSEPKAIANVTEEQFDMIVRDAKWQIKHTIREEIGISISDATAEKLGELLNDFLIENVCAVED